MRLTPSQRRQYSARFFIYWRSKMTRGTAGRLIRALGQQAGIERRVNPCLLRTTSACLLAKTMSPWQLREVMGHSSMETTLRYVEAATLDLDEAMQRGSPLDNLRL